MRNKAFSSRIKRGFQLVAIPLKILLVGRIRMTVYLCIVESQYLKRHSERAKKLEICSRALLTVSGVPASHDQ